MRTETRGPSSRKFARRTGLIPLPTRVSKSCANETLRNGQADRLLAAAIPLGRIHMLRDGERLVFTEINSLSRIGRRGIRPESPLVSSRSPKSSCFLSENLACGLVDLLDLEPFVAMLRVYMAHQRFNANLSGFSLFHEITVHSQFLATDRHGHCPSPIAQPIDPEIPVYCVHIRWTPIPWEFRKTNK